MCGGQSEHSLQDLVLAFTFVSSGDQTQVFQHDSSHLDGSGMVLSSAVAVYFTCNTWLTLVYR